MRVGAARAAGGVQHAREQHASALLLNALAAADRCIERAAGRERRVRRARARIAGEQQPRRQHRAQLVVRARVLQQRCLNRQQPQSALDPGTYFTKAAPTVISLYAWHATAFISICVSL